MFNLLDFKLADSSLCNRLIRDFSNPNNSMEKIADTITNFIYNSFSNKNVPNFSLVRIFLILPFKELPSRLQGMCNNINDDTLCLTLLATSGEKYEWNYSSLSEGHQVIPLSSEQFINQLPMIKGIFEQLNVQLSQVNESNSLLVSDKWNDLGNFHVHNAQGSELIPAQEEFVIPYSIQSVLGYGGLLPNKKMFIAIMFSKALIDSNIITLFRPISLSIMYALINSNKEIFTGFPDTCQDNAKSGIVISTTKANILSNLLNVTETTVINTSNRLYNSLNELEIAKQAVERQSHDIEKNYQLQQTISSILKLSFKTMELDECLDLSLDLLFSVPWFSAQSVGCIFLFDPKTQSLQLTARRNFPHQLLEPCKTIKIGKCLCGLAAYTGEIIYSGSMDERHSITYDGIPDHGHYCVPIKSKNNSILGVINIDLKANHQKHLLEEQLLMSFADTLAYIIEKFNLNNKLKFLANYDTLTNIPNRNLLYDRLEEQLKVVKRYNDRIALLYVDLDKFKIINDNFGHDVGDILLKTTASRLKDCIRDTDTVARLGGDEFAIMITRFNDISEIEEIATRITQSLAQDFKIKNNNHRVIASIGVSIAPDDGNISHELFKKADIAMYAAKSSGGNKYLFYDKNMGQSLTERHKLENDIRYATENNEFILHYQPKINLSTGKTVGIEALIRWQHPALGLIEPDKFISIAEETGVIVQIGEWVLRTACRDLKHWRQQGVPSKIILAVNISMIHFTSSNFLTSILPIISETEIEPKAIEFEITESVAMQNVEKVSMILKELHSYGIHLAVDDFGTGYSSLSYLRYLPFDSIKIDKSFIQNAPYDSDEHIIVKTIIDMGHNLKLKVVAEGVETIEQLALLEKLGCEEAQGFLFSKPLPPDDLLKFLQKE